jgi:hypothetical protein
MIIDDPNNEIVIQADDSLLNKLNVAQAHDANSFAYQLRALGQALEKFNLSAFDLEVRSGSYVVMGKQIAIPRVRLSFSRFIRQLISGALSRASVANSDAPVDLRFSCEEIAQFDLLGKSQRQDSSKMSDPFRLSQILRGVGALLEYRNIANLLGISLRGKRVTVRYQTSKGILERHIRISNAFTIIGSKCTCAGAVARN